MNVHDIIKNIQNWFHGLVQSLKPALDMAEKLGGEAALSLAETVLTNMAADASWSVIVDAFIAEAKTQGKDFIKEEASVLLNLAKANILAKAA